MRAWLLNEFSGLSALTLADGVPIPEPTAGEVRLRLTHAALNPADRFLAEKLYPARPPLPHILGRDGCGTVDAVGDGVSNPRPGERVVILRGETGVEQPGTFADYVVVPAAELAPAPNDWTDAQAASAALVYETAHQALTQWGALEPTTVLITGVTGGVGMASLHLAKAWGHRVVGLTRSAQKRPVLEEEGCDLIVDTNAEDLRDRVKEFTKRIGVRLVIDTLGGAVFSRAIDCLGHGGCVSVIGMLAGPVPTFNTAKLIFKRIRIGGVHVGDYDPPRAQAAWKEIVESLHRLGAAPRVDSVYPMPQLLTAFERLKAGPIGKIVLAVQ